MTSFYLLEVLELKLSLMLARQVLYHLSQACGKASASYKVLLQVLAYMLPSQ
jgi:hypothetical protein